MWRPGTNVLLMGTGELIELWTTLFRIGLASHWQQKFVYL